MTSRFRKWLMDSPPVEWGINRVRDLLIGALKQGPVPRHIAFVMDGNRRWAREQRVETVEGHSRGYEAMAKILEVCYRSGVKTVTVYAFSIENFKRSKHEVDALMDMAKIKLTQMAQHGELLDQYGARVKVIGRRSLLKPDVLAAIERAEQMTAGNDKCVLNICFPYTSQEEITSALRDTVEDFSKPIVTPATDKGRRSFQEERIANTIRSQHLSDHAASQNQQLRLEQVGTLKPSSNNDNATNLSPSSSTTSLSSRDPMDQDDEHDDTTSSSSILSTNATTTSTTPMKISSTGTLPPTYPSPELITSATLNRHMYTAADPPLDLLIRTSGVARLSDFMLWQCHETTHIVFLDILWPQFDLWTFLPVLWEWQWRARKEETALRDKERVGSGGAGREAADAAAANTAGTTKKTSSHRITHADDGPADLKLA